MVLCAKKITLSVFIGFLSLGLSSAFAETRTQVLYVGDSHSAGSFGRGINDWMRSKPSMQFVFEASGGSAPLQWINNAFYSSCGYHDDFSLTQSPPRTCVSHFHTQTVKSLLVKLKEGSVDTNSKWVIVALGTNFGDQPSLHQEQVIATSNLIKSIYAQGFRCVWIGPPHMKRFDEKRVGADYQIIKEGITKAAHAAQSEPCTLIDSRLISHYPVPTNPAHENPDGIHYDYPLPGYRFPEGKAAALEWAKIVVQELEKIIY